MFLDNSKYNLCAGISNGINSCFHVQPSRIRNPAKSLWKYILCRRIHWRGRRGNKLQIGNVSWSQPFLHFSFPAKAKSSLILTRCLLGGMKNARKWTTFDQNLSKIRLFGRGGKLTGCLKHMLTATHIGSLESPLDIKDEKGKPLKNINGSEKISKLLKILIIF